MKKITVIIMMVVSSILCVNAQIKIEGDNWSVSPYVGMLSATGFSTDSFDINGFTSMRFGVVGEYKATKWLGFTGRTVYEVNVFHKELFNVDIHPTKSLLIRSGYMCSLATYQRPDVVSGPGQFETWTESQIPGGALGTDIRLMIQNGDVGIGIYERDGLEYQFRVNYKKLTGSGSYNESGHWSIQISWTGDIVYSALVIQDTVVANISILNVGNFSIYNDIGFYHKSEEMPRWEIGILKNFAHKKYPASGLFGLGYAYEKKAVMGYLFLHLTPKKK